MIFKSAALTGCLAAVLSLGCDANPNSSSGTNAVPTAGQPVGGDNTSNPGSNPGLSGAAPHPDVQTAPPTEAETPGTTP
ncbi:MAG: hypothetical protein ACO1RT_19065 [Planctomycetaceae bacterium]